MKAEQLQNEVSPTRVVAKRLIVIGCSLAAAERELAARVTERVLTIVEKLEEEKSKEE